MKPEKQTTQGRQFHEISSTRRCEFSTNFLKEDALSFDCAKLLDCVVGYALMFSILVSGLKDLKVSSIMLFILWCIGFYDCTRDF